MKIIDLTKEHEWPGELLMLCLLMTSRCEPDHHHLMIR